MALRDELGLDAPFENIRHEAVLNILHTAGLLNSLGAALCRRFGLTEAQFNVLYALRYKQGVITQTELGRRLLVTRASITSVLDKLEEKGLIMRVSVPDNRRIYHVELTSRGVALVDDMEPLYQQCLGDATQALGEPACRGLIRTLERIRSDARAVQHALRKTPGESMPYTSGPGRAGHDKGGDP